MDCHFRVGQKVICVHALDSAEFLIEKKIYTIQDIFNDIGVIFLTLKEVPVMPQKQCGWFHWRFRPIAETKTDISVFNKMLPPTTKVKKKQLEKI